MNHNDESDSAREQWRPDIYYTLKATLLLSFFRLRYRLAQGRRMLAKFLRNIFFWITRIGAMLLEAITRVTATFAYRIADAADGFRLKQGLTPVRPYMTKDRKRGYYQR